MTDDTDLLLRYSRSRDAEAFSELVRRYSAMVFSVSRRVTGNSATAEDVTQDCFLALARSAKTIRGSLPAWLHRVALRRALNANRNQATRERYESQAAAADAIEPTWEQIAPFIDKALSELPDDLREPLVQHFLLEKTQTEIAESANVGQATISRRIDAGIVQLRAHLRGAGLAVAAPALGQLLGHHGTEAAPATLTASLGKMALAGPAPSATLTMATFLTAHAKLVAFAGFLVLVAAAIVTLQFGANKESPTMPATRQGLVAPTITPSAATRSATLAAITNLERAWTVDIAARVYDICFSPDSRAILAANGKDALILFDAATGKEIRQFKGSWAMYALAFSPDGRQISAISDEPTTTGDATTGTNTTNHIWINRWDVQTGERTRHEDAGGSPFGLTGAITPDARWALFPTSNGLVIRDLDAADAGRQVGPKDLSWPVALSPDASHFAASPAKYTAFAVFATSTGRQLWRVALPDALRATFSPDGKRVAVTSSGDAAWVFETATGQKLAQLELPKALRDQFHYIGRPVFNSTGVLLITGGTKSLSVWDLGTGQAIACRDDPNAFYGMAISPDGRRLASGTDGHLAGWILSDLPPATSRNDTK